jgi:hypothetical protein
MNWMIDWSLHFITGSCSIFYHDLCGFQVWYLNAFIIAVMFLTLFIFLSVVPLDLMKVWAIIDCKSMIPWPQMNNVYLDFKSVVLALTSNQGFWPWPQTMFLTSTSNQWCWPGPQINDVDLDLKSMELTWTSNQWYWPWPQINDIDLDLKSMILTLTSNQWNWPGPQINDIDLDLKSMMLTWTSNQWYWPRPQINDTLLSCVNNIGEWMKIS